MKLAAASGDGQTGTAGKSLPSPLVVTATDSQGNPVAGLAVSFAASSGASVSPASANTDATGKAQATLTLGAAPGTDTVTTSAPGATSVSFNETALPVGTHYVTLSWNASTSANVVGYDVYRGSTSGGPYQKISAAPVASTSFTDTAVSSGVTYYYVATALSNAGLESVDSSEATATIP